MRRKKKFLLERDIQKACVEWARKQGYWARKFSSPANRAVPDYLFSKRTGAYAEVQHALAVEFKAPGKTSTAAQVEEQVAMRDAGWVVHEIDDIEEFKTILTTFGIGWLE